jgi:hypothetical protein
MGAKVRKEVRRQKTEVRRQKSEDRSQKAEDFYFGADLSSPSPIIPKMKLGIQAAR